MAEEIIESLPDSQGTPPAEGSESATEVTSQESQDQSSQEKGQQEQESQPQHSEDTQENNTEGQSEQQGAKPTRAERRITQLLSRLKGSPQETNSDQPVVKDGKPYLFTPEEVEAGEVDPVALETRMQQKIQQGVQQEVQRALEMDRVNRQYEAAVKDNLADLETIADLDPDIEQLAVQQYEAVNHQINPITGKKMFIPAVKMSEIVKKITDTINKTAENVAASNREYATNVSQNQAVSTNGSMSSAGKVRGDTTDFKEFEKAFSPSRA